MFATITDVRMPRTGILPFSITPGRAQFGCHGTGRLTATAEEEEDQNG